MSMTWSIEQYENYLSVCERERSKLRSEVERLRDFACPCICCASTGVCPDGAVIGSAPLLAEIAELRAQLSSAWEEGYDQSTADIDWTHPWSTRRISNNPYKVKK